MFPIDWTLLTRSIRLQTNNALVVWNLCMDSLAGHILPSGHQLVITDVEESSTMKNVFIRQIVVKKRTKVVWHRNARQEEWSKRFVPWIKKAHSVYNKYIFQYLKYKLFLHLYLQRRCIDLIRNELNTLFHNVWYAKLYLQKRIHVCILCLTLRVLLV